jgi:hypothetical protein
MDNRSFKARQHSIQNTASQGSATKVSDWNSPSVLTEENLGKFSKGPSWAFVATLNGISLITNRPDDLVDDEVLDEIATADQAMAEAVNELSLIDDNNVENRLEIVNVCLNRKLLNDITHKNSTIPPGSEASRSYITTDQNVVDQLVGDGSVLVRNGQDWTTRGMRARNQLRSHLNPTQEATPVVSVPSIGTEEEEGPDPGLSTP